MEIGGGDQEEIPRRAAIEAQCLLPRGGLFIHQASGRRHLYCLRNLHTDGVEGRVAVDRVADRRGHVQVPSVVVIHRQLRVPARKRKYTLAHVVDAVAQRGIATAKIERHSAVEIHLQLERFTRLELHRQGHLEHGVRLGELRLNWLPIQHNILDCQAAACQAGSTVRKQTEIQPVKRDGFSVGIDHTLAAGEVVRLHIQRQVDLVTRQVPQHFDIRLGGGDQDRRGKLRRRLVRGLGERGHRGRCRRGWQRRRASRRQQAVGRYRLKRLNKPRATAPRPKLAG